MFSLARWNDRPDSAVGAGEFSPSLTKTHTSAQLIICAPSAAFHMLLYALKTWTGTTATCWCEKSGSFCFLGHSRFIHASSWFWAIHCNYLDHEPDCAFLIMAQPNNTYTLSHTHELVFLDCWHSLFRFLPFVPSVKRTPFSRAKTGVPWPRLSPKMIKACYFAWISGTIQFW